jgi:hypothetical protein
MISNGGGSHPKWSGDGTALFYLAPDHTIMSAHVNATKIFHADAPQSLFRANIIEDFRAGFAVDSDGKRFLIPIAQSSTTSPTFTVVVNWASELRSETH